MDGGGKNRYSYSGPIFEVFIRYPGGEFRTVAGYINLNSVPLP